MSLDNLRDDIATKQKKGLPFNGICCGMDIYYCYSYFEY